MIELSPRDRSVLLRFLRWRGHSVEAAYDKIRQYQESLAATQARSGDSKHGADTVEDH
jgi:hypothetical protein